MQNDSHIFYSSFYTPSDIIKSEQLMDSINSEMRFGLSRNIINEKLGINERRFVSEEENSYSYLATCAVQKLLDQSKVDPKKIDCLIYCGIESGNAEPAVAHEIQKNIGSNGICFNINNACHGFCDALFIANSFVKQGMDNIIIVSAEISSSVTKAALSEINKDGNKIKTMFGALTVGDAAGAALITSYPNSDYDLKILNFNLSTQSKYHDFCYYRKLNNELIGRMRMEKISGVTINLHRRMLKETLSKADWNEPDYLVTHQVGIRPFEKIRKMVGVRNENISKTFDYLGNIASATLPVNLSLLLQKADTRPEKLLLMGAGSGISISQIPVLGIKTITQAKFQVYKNDESKQAKLHHYGTIN